MTEYPSSSHKDRNAIAGLPTEKLLDFFFLQTRNLWRVDGLYFLGIEKKFGTEAASEIDADVWETMAKIEAKSLQRMFDVGSNPDTEMIVWLLGKSSWALDQPFKTAQVVGDKIVLDINRCRTQETRLNKGLHEFPCKKVRFGYLRAFANTLNPKAKVRCIICPPDKHPEEIWCKWEFTVQK